MDSYHKGKSTQMAYPQMTYPDQIPICFQNNYVNAAQSKTIMILRDAIRNTPFESCSYLVGGSVRDILLGREINDYDVCVEMPKGGEKLAEYLHEYGHCSKPQRLNKHAVLTCKHGSRTIEFIQTLKKHGRSSIIENDFGNLDEDASSRDFTINAIYIRLGDMLLLDPTKRGLSDLCEKVIRPITNASACFNDDPLRLLRAIRMSIDLKFEIDPILWSDIKLHSSLISDVHFERISKEIQIALRADPAKTLGMLHESCIMKHLSPDLNDACGLLFSSGITAPKLFGPVSQHPRQKIDIKTLVSLLTISLDNAATNASQCVNMACAQEITNKALEFISSMINIPYRYSSRLKALGIVYCFLCSATTRARLSILELRFIHNLLGSDLELLKHMLKVKMVISKRSKSAIHGLIADMHSASAALQNSTFPISGTDIISRFDKKDHKQIGKFIQLLELHWLQNPSLNKDELLCITDCLLPISAAGNALQSISGKGKSALLWELNEIEKYIS